MRFFLFGLLLCLLGADPAHGQRFDHLPIDMAAVPYYRFVRAGEPSVQLLVIGTGASGFYEVGAGTHLGELVVLAGGGAAAAGTRTSRVNVRLYREQAGGREMIYGARMEELITEPSLAPDLRDGDVFAVEVVPRMGFGWRDILTVATTVLSTTLLILRLRRWTS